MSYTIEPSSNGLGYRFTKESIKFECSYARAIDVDDFEIHFDPEKPALIQNSGSLVYNLDVNVNDIGEMSTLIFTPQHNITDIIAT